MDTKQTDRRTFIKSSLSTAAIAAAPLVLTARKGDAAQAQASPTQPAGEPRIRFAAIGVQPRPRLRPVRLADSGRRTSSSASTPRNLTSRRQFAKRYPTATLAKSEQEILDDKRIALVASAAIASERAPLGIRVMKAGKDFLSDKPVDDDAGAARRGPQGAGRDQADLLGHVQRAAREPRHREGRRAGAGRRHRQGDPDRRSRAAPRDPRRGRTAGLVLRQGAVRRHPHRHRLAPVRSVPLLHRTRPKRRSSPRRSATCATRTSPASRTSAT